MRAISDFGDEIGKMDIPPSALVAAMILPSR